MHLPTLAPRPFKTPYAPLKKTISKAGTQRAARGLAQGAGRGLVKGTLRTAARFVPGLGPAANVGLPPDTMLITAQQEGT